jgi:hypothetical protein
MSSASVVGENTQRRRASFCDTNKGKKINQKYTDEIIFFIGYSLYQPKQLQY